MRMKHHHAGWVWSCVQALACGCLLSGAVAQEGAARPGALPPVPVLVSRVEPFRQLLAADVGEREKLLALRPVEQREQFRQALRDYDSLAPAERERRLQALELRFQLTYLIPLAAEVRTQAVARLPAASQPLVRDGLDYWNRSSPEVQKQLLASGQLLKDFITRIVSIVINRPPMPAGVVSTNLWRARRAVSSWNSLPESKRTAVRLAFGRMLESGSTETAAGVFPPAERDDMKQVLERYQHLSPSGKRLCLDSLGKLLKMSPEELQVFLRSAEEWQKISPKDREAWRNLVKKSPVFPPPPPGYRRPPLPEPAGTLVATNRDRLR